MIVDANVLVSAFLGRSFALLLETRERGIELIMPEHQWLESRLILARRGWTHPAFNGVAAGVIRPLPIEDYATKEADARVRLHERGQPGWAVLAAAIARDDAIWSNDRDFFGVGVPVWTTRNIHLAKAAA